MATRRAALCNGFSLIELLLVLAIAGILFQSGLRSFQQSLIAARSGSAMQAMAGLFASARHAAILGNATVTVCAVDDRNVCHRLWNKQHRISVFQDQNRNRRIDPEERVLRELRWPMEGGELSWRASLGRTYIEFNGNGGTWQNGTLYYCPASRDARHARAMVISHSGRSYLTVDSNGDGIREDRSGRNLRC